MKHGHRAIRGLVAGTLVLASSLLGSEGSPLSCQNVWAGSGILIKRGTTRGDTERGQQIFNGKGFCLNCHGRDGEIGRRPPLAPEIANMVAQLKPPPADLRNPSTLKSKDDRERHSMIKEGHPGTAMLPHTFLSDQEIRDLLAYLSTLRAGATKGTKVEP